MINSQIARYSQPEIDLGHSTTWRSLCDEICSEMTKKCIEFLATKIENDLFAGNAISVSVLSFSSGMREDSMTAPSVCH